MTDEYKALIYLWLFLFLRRWKLVCMEGLVSLHSDMRRRYSRSISNLYQSSTYPWWKRMLGK